MIYQLPPVTWLRAFEAAARHSSFAAAANELHMTSTAISHQIRSLESASDSDCSSGCRAACA